MKSASFILDRHLYELLQEKAFTCFTIRELRDGYAACMDVGSYELSDVRRYVYEQVRRMLRLGWLTLDLERRSRGQVYHLKSLPPQAQLELCDNGFEKSLSGASHEQRTAAVDHISLTEATSPDPALHLEALHKEIRLDFLTSMGEAERYKLLFEEMPQLRDSVGPDYLEARDRSSRLLGHLRALEKTLQTLSATQ